MLDYASLAQFLLQFAFFAEMALKLTRIVSPSFPGLSFLEFASEPVNLNGVDSDAIIRAPSQYCGTYKLYELAQRRALLSVAATIISNDL